MVDPRPVRVLIELNPTVDSAEWARAHLRGEVPDLAPYGLDRLRDHGMTPIFRSWPRSAALRWAGRGVARFAGPARWLESSLGSPDASDVDASLCWDERTAIPQLLDPRSRDTPLVTGVIWLTEPDEPVARPLRALTGIAMRRADALFVLSAAQKPVLARSWGIEEDRIHVVPFGIDVDFWSSDAVGLGSGDPEKRGAARIVSVGNDRHRRHEVTIHAAELVRRTLPTTRLDLVTHAPAVVSEPLGTRHAHLRHHELRDLYARSDVAVVSSHPNLHVSGITATLEAMSMGLPVVVSRTAGMEDYVRDGETGLLVKAGDPVALAEAVSCLLHDPASAASMGHAARRAAVERFSTRRQAGDLAALIGRVVADSASLVGG